MPSPTERGIVIGLALIRTALCAWRAATQSFVLDEAFTYHNFTAGSWHDLYFRYDANNHLLYSLLSKLSMTLSGIPSSPSAFRA